MDIDIDFPTTFDKCKVFSEITCASMVSNGELKPHAVGAYFQNVPKDKATGSNLCAIPYKEAAKLGIMKIDFLHLNLLDGYTSKDEIREVISNEDYNWDALQDEKVVSQLFQISGHIEIIKLIKPRSVEQLADCVAIIRPTKRKLLDQYLKDPVSVRPKLFRQPGEDKSAFKKSHATAYALTILLQLNKIMEKQ